MTLGCQNFHPLRHLAAGPPISQRTAATQFTLFNEVNAVGSRYSEWAILELNECGIVRLAANDFESASITWSILSKQISSG